MLSEILIGTWKLAWAWIPFIVVMVLGIIMEAKNGNGSK